MRLQVLSDLHLERAPFAMTAVDADAVVLAGDVATGTRGLMEPHEGPTVIISHHAPVEVPVPPLAAMRAGRATRAACWNLISRLRFPV